jgi:hypothetical protein
MKESTILPPNSTNSPFFFIALSGSGNGLHNGKNTY